MFKRLMNATEYKELHLQSAMVVFKDEEMAGVIEIQLISNQPRCQNTTLIYTSNQNKLCEWLDECLWK